MRFAKSKKNPGQILVEMSPKELHDLQVLVASVKDPLRLRDSFPDKMAWPWRKRGTITNDVDQVRQDFVCDRVKRMAATPDDY